MKNRQDLVHVMKGALVRIMIILARFLVLVRALYMLLLSLLPTSTEEEDTDRTETTTPDICTGDDDGC